jgi:hypothetical protein
MSKTDTKILTDLIDRNGIVNVRDAIVTILRLRASALRAEAHQLDIYAAGCTPDEHTTSHS